ncbi:MAG TPA: hypothetical protein VGG06_15725 [Thermoanaerobaculia bacterium]|jgi:hypothetical protein
MEPTIHRHPARSPGPSPRRRPSVADDPGEIALRTSCDADGNVVVEEIPLTLEILLNPSEDVHVPQGNPHRRLLDPLVERLQRYLERRGDWGVFSDLMVHWARKDLRAVAPDVTVAQGIADPDAVDENLDVAAVGCRVRAVFEVVTTRSKKKREKDEVHNKPLFAAAGVEDYVLLYPAKYRQRGDRAVRHFTLAAGRYREQRADAQGRFRLRSLGLWLSVDESEELVLVDMATGERLPTPDEEEERRLQAERRAAEEATTRQAAERRAAEETAARQAAEQALRAANRRSAQLLVAVLESRGLTMDAEARQRILDCDDPRKLERWAENAFTVATVEDLWEDLPPSHA